MGPSYRQQFEGKDRAEFYDRDQYAPGSYSDILWQIEKVQLATVLADFRESHSEIQYLDFATGTGRILRFMEDKVDDAIGIEISSAMVAQARLGLTKAQVICADITQPGAPIESRYDLITAFRFVLNAEPELRILALTALAARLRDETSVLVFNNHGNLLSLKALLRPLHLIRKRSRRWETSGNVMTAHQVRRLTDLVGLEIVQVLGCGVLTGRVASLMPQPVALAIERLLSRLRFTSRFGVNQMYVAKLSRRSPLVSE